LLHYIKASGSTEGFKPMTTTLLRSTRFKAMINALLAVVIARVKNPLPLVMPEYLPPGPYPKDSEARVHIARWIDDTFAPENARLEAREGAFDLVQKGWVNGQPAFRASVERRPSDLEFVVGARLLHGMS
jgi:hypothetical protein